MYLLSSISTDIAREHAATPHDARSFLRVLLATSLVLEESAQRRREFREYIRTLDPQLQALWIEVVKKCLQREGVAPHIGCGCPSLHGIPADVRVDSTPCANSGTQCGNCNMRFIEWPQLVNAQILQGILRERETSVPSGADRQHVFDSRILPIVAGAKSITIIDRYAGRAVVRSGQTSGLAWLLGALWSRRDIDVTLITGTGSGVHASDIVQACSIIVSTARPGVTTGKKLKLWTGRDTRFRDHAHDRFLSVMTSNRSIAVSLGKGLELFAHHQVQQPCTTQLLIDDPAIPDTLRNLGYNDSACQTI